MYLRQKSKTNFRGLDQIHISHEKLWLFPNKLQLYLYHQIQFLHIKVYNSENQHPEIAAKLPRQTLLLERITEEE